MGMMIQKPLKNYTIPILAQNKVEQIQRVKPNIPFYEVDLVKKEY